MQNLDGLLLQRQTKTDVIDLHYVYSAVIYHKDRHFLLVYLLNDKAVPAIIVSASIESEIVNLGLIIKIRVTSNYFAIQNSPGAQRKSDSSGTFRN